jgi:type IV pilus assembly protein PilW
MKSVGGFSLIELMISLTLGLIIATAVIQIFVSTRVTSDLNQSLSELQNSGRYIALRLESELQQAGRYDAIMGNVDTSVDTTIEASFVQNMPVAIAGDYISNLTLGSIQDTSNDELVINMLSNVDCTGNHHGYADDLEFHVVNHYFIEDSQLKCEGFDGRVLRGLKSSSVTSSTAILMDNVVSVQFEYGVTEGIDESSGNVIQFITADAIDTIRGQEQQVVAIRFAVLLRSENGARLAQQNLQVALLNEETMTLDSDYYYQVFTHHIALRNSINYAGSTVL